MKSYIERKIDKMTASDNKTCNIGPLTIGGGELVVIAGPCLAEGLDMCMDIAEVMAEICRDLGIGYVFKTSFDKANRSSVSSFRGPGMQEGLSWLEAVADKIGCPVLTDIHESAQARPVAEVVDCIQIPAFLCRQTDLLVAAGETQKPVNIKKGQFLAPWDMANPVEKVQSTGNDQILLTERGTMFGYNRLVTDFRAISQMQSLAPVVFDATHSTQEPGGLGSASGGQRQFAAPLAAAAIAVGADALFFETHRDPDNARCDAACQLPVESMCEVLTSCKSLFDLRHK